MNGILKSMRTMFRTALAIDRRSLLICLAYNLIKQLMNVFYGVYFLRMILAGLETGRSLGHILAVLGVMFGINVLYGRFSQYYNHEYLPVFRLKADCFMNEKIMEKANSIPYDTANSPRELDRYSRVMENSSKRMIQLYQSFGLICGLLEAFAMILYYIVRTDVFAVFFSAFPLLYSYFLGEKSTELAYELNKKLSSAARKKEYAGRVYYLQRYGAEMRTSKIGRIVRGIYMEGSAQTADAYRRDGKKIAGMDFLELLLGDAMSMVLPLAYVVVRMLCGARYLLGDFIGITQAITIFSSDVEWMLDEALEMKSASLYINDYTDYLSREVYSAGASEGNQPEHGKCQFRNPGGNQSEHGKCQFGNPGGNQPEHGKCQFGNPGGNQSEHGKCQFGNPGGNQSEHGKCQFGNPGGNQSEHGVCQLENSEGNLMEHAKRQIENPGGNQREHRKRQSGEPEAGQPEDLKRSRPGKFCITFDHVKYHYPGSPEGISALDDVSIDIRNGEKIAIVGRNGAGKTTFVSLLVNLISCSGGKITLNGREMDTYEREELKSFFGVVCQDYKIYPVSVRDNVSIGGKASAADIRDALEKVGLAGRIPDINAVIGKEIDDRGLVLSGGEQQRLALARVIANPFPVVVLDEPTSALDAVTERNMNRLILDALKDTGRTLLFISHKLSTTKLVDRILVFEGGRLVEDGNHRVLMEKGGLYAEMYLEQNSLYKGVDT